MFKREENRLIWGTKGQTINEGRPATLQKINIIKKQNSTVVYMYMTFI